MYCFCECAVMWLPNYAVVWLCIYLAMQTCGYTIALLCNFVSLRPGGCVVL